MISKSFNFINDGCTLAELFHDEPYLAFLDSSQKEFDRGRYSFIGFDPFEVFNEKGDDALSQLRKKFLKFQTKKTFELSALDAGIIGLLSYDGECHFGFYDCILTIDHMTKRLTISSSGLPEKNSTLRKKRAQNRLDYAINKLKFLSQDDHQDVPKNISFDKHDLLIRSNFSKNEYLNAIDIVKDYIRRGDIYQVNLSQRFEYDLQDDNTHPLEIYKLLRSFAPSCFGAFMDFRDFQIMSNSPERFLHLQNEIVQTRPMKGTRPRGTNQWQDQKLKEEILKSRKERAELLMITDLMRNDLGRVCDYGSVHVKDMREIEEYNYVFQATSTVEGVLRKDKDCFDLLGACFPGGSITGCPKIRAMEIIEELEPTPRGFYTGSLGYISFSGNMDFNILIRTIVASQKKLNFQVGGGIVADSVPEKEYEETLIKAKAIISCLEYIFHKSRAKTDLLGALV